MLDEIKSNLELSMDKTVDSLKYQLTKVRTGELQQVYSMGFLLTIMECQHLLIKLGK